MNDYFATPKVKKLFNNSKGFRGCCKKVRKTGRKCEKKPSFNFKAIISVRQSPNQRFGVEVDRNYNEAFFYDFAPHFDSPSQVPAALFDAKSVDPSAYLSGTIWLQRQK